MLILNFIENKFQKLNHVNRTLLYLLPLIILISWIFTLPKTLTNIKEENEIIIIQERIKQLNKKISSTPDVFNLIRRIEKFSKENDIVIKSIKHEQGLYHVEFHSKKTRVEALVNFCEYLNAFSKINYLKVFINKDEADVSMKLSFLNYYVKKTKPSLLSRLKKPNKTFVLNAIINQEVLINNQWLNLHDTVLDYKIHSISMNKVELINKNERLILELFDETK